MTVRMTRTNSSKGERPVASSESPTSPERPASISGLRIAPQVFAFSRAEKPDDRPAVPGLWPTYREAEDWSTAGVLLRSVSAPRGDAKAARRPSQALADALAVVPEPRLSEHIRALYVRRVRLRRSAGQEGPPSGSSDSRVCELGRRVAATTLRGVCGSRPTRRCQIPRSRRPPEGVVPRRTATHPQSLCHSPPTPSLSESSP